MKMNIFLLNIICQKVQKLINHYLSFNIWLFSVTAIILSRSLIAIISWKDVLSLSNFMILLAFAIDA